MAVYTETSLTRVPAGICPLAGWIQQIIASVINSRTVEGWSCFLHLGIHPFQINFSFGINASNQRKHPFWINFCFFRSKSYSYSANVHCLYALIYVKIFFSCTVNDISQFSSIFFIWLLVSDGSATFLHEISSKKNDIYNGVSCVILRSFSDTWLPCKHSGYMTSPSTTHHANITTTNTHHAG